MDDTANEGACFSKNEKDEETETETERKNEFTPAKTTETESILTHSSKKDSSIEEDFLGANSLLMSDSDCENDKEVENTNNDQQVNIKSVDVQLIIQTENSENDTQLKTNIVDEATEIPKMPTKKLKKKKISAILDSESEDDDGPTATRTTSSVIKAKPKFSALIDTDSETDEDKELESEAETAENERNFKVFDFDEQQNESEIDHENKNGNVLKQKQSKKKNLTKKQSVRKSKIIDSDSEIESVTSSNENVNADEQEGLEVAEDINTKEPKQKKMRSSAKKALDEIQVIQSEQQRLHREAHISVPYHKPKRYTLQEFLKRRTIIRPSIENDCSPAAAIVKQKNLKMSAEELEEYAHLMEEREKEARQFFKSESESESEEEKEIFKDNVGVMDVEETESNVNQNEVEVEAITNTILPTVDADINQIVELPLESEDFNRVETLIETKTENTEIAKSSVVQFMPVDMLTVNEGNSQPIVTEVLELPRLDLSTLHINEEDMESSFSEPTKAPVHETVTELPIKQFLTELHATDSPRLKGNENMLIDLETDDLIEKEPTGADNLLQRLLATRKAKKAKTNETVNILSTENGKLEMTKVNIHIHEETNANKEQKPGAAYFKLKENLKTLIREKRLQEIQKKHEDEDEYNKCLEYDDNDDECDENELDEYEIENDEKVKKTKQKIKYDEIVVDEEENAVCISDDVFDTEAVEDSESNEDDEDIDEVITEEGKETESKLIYDENDDEKNAEKVRVSESESSDDDDDDEDDDNQKHSDAYKFKTPISETQRKNRIIHGFAADSEDEDEDDIDLLKTQPQIIPTNIVTPLFGPLDSPIKSNLSFSIDDHDDVANTQELMDLCSGTFDATQNSRTTTTADTVVMSQIPMTFPQTATDTAELMTLCSGTFEGATQLDSLDSTNAAVISQIPMTQKNSDLDTRAELLTLCSGTFDQQNTQQTSKDKPDSPKHASSKAAVYKILSSDEEDSSKKLTQDRVRKLRKKLRKGQVKLGFSDDEAEIEDNPTVDNKKSTDDGQENENDDEAVEVEGEEDMPETYVEYDSEENEVVVQLTKKDCIKRAENFFENEAELSDSEWGSADEDEKNLDHYDIELGDEDEFDRSELQQELGKIHARKQLDEDIREVRKIQEMLFEDEENDGVGRQRQFRWKHAENGFNLDDLNQSHTGENGIDPESGDEEQKQEHLWRKIRFEREQVLQEQGIKKNSQEYLGTSTSIVNSPLTTIMNNVGNVSKSTTPTAIGGGSNKKFQIITKRTALSSVVKQKGSPFLISTTKKTATTTITGTGTTGSSASETGLPKISSILQPKAARGSFLMRDKESLSKFANITKNIGASSFETDETAGTVSVKTVKAKNFVFATLTKEEHEHLKRKADDLMNSSSETGVNFMKKPRRNGPTDKECFIDKLLS